MKKFTKAMCLVCVLALAVTAFAACGGAKSNSYTANNTEFVIGMSGPLTGGAAIYGTAVRNAAEMAVEEINANGAVSYTHLTLPTKA